MEIDNPTEKFSIAKVKIDKKRFILNELDPKKEDVEVVSFIVPKTIEEARSAYCHNPSFNMAVDLYASKENKTPEEVLLNNLQMGLHVRSELLGESKESKSERLEKSPLVQSKNKNRETIESLRRKYVDGYIDIFKFEREIDKILNEDQSIKYDIKDYLIYHEPIEQSRFLDFIENETMYSRREAISCLRELMEDNEISYTIEYNLQIE